MKGSIGGRGRRRDEVTGPQPGGTGGSIFNTQSPRKAGHPWGILGTKEPLDRRETEELGKDSSAGEVGAPLTWGRLGVRGHKEEIKTPSAEGKGKGRQPGVFLDWAADAFVVRDP